MIPWLHWNWDAEAAIRFNQGSALAPARVKGQLGSTSPAGIHCFSRLIPGSLSASDCSLAVVVTNRASGSSDPYSLGRVVRLPRIERFVLTSKRLGESLYEGVLTGGATASYCESGLEREERFSRGGHPHPLPGRPQKANPQGCFALAFSRTACPDLHLAPRGGSRAPHPGALLRQQATKLRTAGYGRPTKASKTGPAASLSQEPDILLFL